MWIWWFLPLVFHNVRTQQIDEVDRMLIMPKENCLLNCDGNYDCRLFGTDDCTELEYHFDLNEMENIKIRRLLLYGHNGLRNRLSLKLKLCDLFYINWDHSLAELANRRHKYCERKLDCARTFNETEDVLRDLHHKRVFKGETKDFAVNSFFVDNIYLPNFIEFALNSWYDSHNELTPPKYIESEEKNYYLLIGYNNFTHMINPHSHRMGCSYARFVNGLSLICYYFPQIKSNRLILRKKPKLYQCPYNFPLRDTVFNTLCKYALYSTS